MSEEKNVSDRMLDAMAGLTVESLAKIIKDAIIARSQREPNPLAFQAQILARLAQMDSEDELIALGCELGILDSGVRNEANGGDKN
jgi:hypothetical protein